MQKYLFIFFVPLNILYATPETIVLKLPLQVGISGISIERVKERKPRFISQATVPTLSHPRSRYSSLMYINEEGKKVRSDMIEYFADEAKRHRLYTQFVAQYTIAERP